MWEAQFGELYGLRQIVVAYVICRIVYCDMKKMGRIQGRLVAKLSFIIQWEKSQIVIPVLSCLIL
jgi:hypothetical protein